MNNIENVATLVEQSKEELLRNWRAKVKALPSAQHLDIPTLNDHVPALIDELVVAFRERSDAATEVKLLDGAPPIHGIQRVVDGYDIDEVVAEYNMLRACVHDLADSQGVVLQGQPFHVINLVFDQAIGLAVQTFATMKALEVQKRREDYLAFVAHDLRTPLNAIALAVRILERKFAVPSESENVHLFKTLHRNVEHLSTLVANVLKENANLATETGIKVERREFDLWPLVEILIHDIHPVAGTASTELVNEIPDDLVVFADASLMRRIFQNLIANAIKYTPRGRVVIQASTNTRENVVECRVRDDGMGIPKDRLQSIFEKFETDETSPDGLGLGLAIVKTFVEAHGGTVGVESKESVRSTFKFTIPLKSPPQEKSSD